MKGLWRVWRRVYGGSMDGGSIEGLWRVHEGSMVLDGGSIEGLWRVHGGSMVPQWRVRAGVNKGSMEGP